MRVLSCNILRPIWAGSGWAQWPDRCKNIAHVIRSAEPDYVLLPGRAARIELQGNRVANLWPVQCRGI